MPASSLPASAADIAPNVPQIRLVSRLAARAARPAFDTTTRCGAGRSPTSMPSGRASGTTPRIESPTPHTAVLGRARMPGARWFPGAQVNYAQQVLRHVGRACGRHARHRQPQRARAAARTGLARDAPAGRVAGAAPQGAGRAARRPRGRLPAQRARDHGRLPRVVSLGGVWSVCAPDMGTPAVLDRFRQIEPKVLIACDGVHYGGRDARPQRGVWPNWRPLPSVTHADLHVNSPWMRRAAGRTISKCTRDDATPRWRPSSRCGCPSTIRCGSSIPAAPPACPSPSCTATAASCWSGWHCCGLHNDLGCSYGANNFGERFHWYSSTGWVMWNAQIAGPARHHLLHLRRQPGRAARTSPTGACCGALARHGVTFFGAGAAFFANCMKAGVTSRRLRRPRACARSAPPARRCPKRRSAGARSSSQSGADIWWCNISGGTDFAAPSSAATASCPGAGADAMPRTRLRGRGLEREGRARDRRSRRTGLHAAHAVDAAVLLGRRGQRSATLQLLRHLPRRLAPRRLAQDHARGRLHHLRPQRRHHQPPRPAHGHQRALQRGRGLPEVLDSMVVDLEYLGRESYMPLFVVLRPGTRWTRR
jgi:acetoacetyl-CoA synthetase